MTTSDTDQLEAVQTARANPKIDGSRTSVQNILAALNTKAGSPSKYTIYGKITIPEWSSAIHGLEWHLQGIAPYNGTGTLLNGCIAASSTEGYFLDFTQAAGGSANVCAVTIPDSSYFHAAGIQMLGDLLAVPMESEDKNKNGKVMCYNVGNLSRPTYLYTVGMPERKASAVALTTYTDAQKNEWALMAVYEYDPRYIRFFRAKASEICNSANPWSQIAYYTGNALDGDQYQSFGMVTQTTNGVDQVYLLGFREDEELHLFLVDTSSTNFGSLTKSTVYKNWSGSNWRDGVGLQVADSTTMRIFGTANDPKGSRSDYTIDVWVWS